MGCTVHLCCVHSVEHRPCVALLHVRTALCEVECAFFICLVCIEGTVCFTTKDNSVTVTVSDVIHSVKYEN